MGNRGPKPKTQKNSPARPAVASTGNRPCAISKLTPAAGDEFTRLVTDLDNKGMLERADLGVITRAAQYKALEDRAQAELDDPLRALDPDTVRMMASISNKYLACLRALGLTLQPSRSVVKTIAKNEETSDPIQSKIKLHG